MARIAHASFVTLAAVSLAVAPLSLEGAAAVGAVALRTIDDLGLPSGSGPRDVSETYQVLVGRVFAAEPAMWGGAYVEGSTLVVNSVTRSPEDARDVLRRAGVPDSVEIRDAAVSLVDLDAAVDVVNATLPEAVSVGPDYSHSRVIVGIDSRRSKSSIDGLPRRMSSPLGASQRGRAAPTIEVAYMEAVAPDLTGRYHDFSPFYGGSAIVLRVSAAASAGGQCSSAFAWNPPSGVSGNYMVTASHCAMPPTGSSRLQVNRIASTGSWLDIGRIAWTSGGSAGTYSSRKGDVALYKLNDTLRNSGYVYTGTYDSASSLAVKGYTNLPQGWKGTGLFTSGAASLGTTGPGEINPNWVSLVNQTVKYKNGQVYTGISVAEHASKCVTPGDSGGAVYQKVSGGVYAVGVISGTNNQGAGLTNCRSYFTPVQAVVDYFGGSVKHG